MLKDQYYSAVCFITILLIIISGCKRSYSKLQEVNIEAKIDNIHQVNISDLAIDVDYVNLEMSENILLNNISKAFVNEHYIILSDSRQCILFSKNGQFISIIGSKGRGPTEYRFLTNLCITSGNDILIQSLYDLIIFRSDGTYKNKITNFFYNSGNYVSSWILIKDTLIFGKVARYTGNEDYRALIVDLCGNLISYFNNLTQFKRKTPVTGDFENDASLSIFNNYMYFKER